MKMSAALPLLALLTALGGAALPAHADHSSATTAGTAVSNVAGTISQANYNEAGVVNGFVVGSNTLLMFPGRVCGGVTTLGTVGQAVTYSGTSRSNSTTGIATVQVSAFSNNATAASYASPVAPTTSAYPATAGAITRLNFDASGAINGFVFTPSGSTTALLAKFGGGVRSTTLSPLLQLGAAVTVTGTTLSTETSCGAAALGTVRVTSLTVGGSTFTFSNRGY